MTVIATMALAQRLLPRKTLWAALIERIDIPPPPETFWQRLWRLLRRRLAPQGTYVYQEVQYPGYERQPCSFDVQISGETMSAVSTDDLVFRMDPITLPVLAIVQIDYYDAPTGGNVIAYQPTTGAQPWAFQP